MISEGDIDMPLYDELIERQQRRGEWQRRYQERVRRETWRAEETRGKEAKAETEGEGKTKAKTKG